MMLKIFQEEHLKYKIKMILYFQIKFYFMLILFAKNVTI